MYARVCACVCTYGRGGEGLGGDSIGSPKSLSTFCCTIVRPPWRRHSIKRRTRHHGRPINPQTKVDYDFSRGHRSRLLLRPVHTRERVHRFFFARRVHWTNLNIERVRRELLRPASPAHREISLSLFFPPYFFFFHFDMNKISMRAFDRQ